MYKIGGRAHTRGITFVSDIARVYTADNDRQTVRVFSARSRRIKATLRKLPLLRAFPAFGRAVTIVFIILIILLLIEAFIPEALYFEFYIPDMIFYASLAVFAAAILVAAVLSRGRLRRLLQYHGAEHMALGTYQNGKALTAENIAQTDRANQNCGSMFIPILIIVGIPLMFVPYSDYIFPVAFCIAFELTLLSRRVKWLSWLRRFGMWAQRKIFTRPPDPAQIESARRGLIALIEIMDKNLKPIEQRILK